MIWTAIVALALVGFLIWSFNSLARMRNVVRNAWSDIDVHLKRRADLIPNLVETTKGYSGFERETLESVMKARNEIASHAYSPAQRAAKEQQIAERVTQIVAVAENYPELKASAQYIRLQQELSDTETNIANARRYYNASVRDLNTMLDSFPLGVVGSLFGFKKAEFFSVESPDQRDAPSAKMDA